MVASAIFSKPKSHLGCIATCGSSTATTATSLSTAAWVCAPSSRTSLHESADWRYDEPHPVDLLPPSRKLPEHRGNDGISVSASLPACDLERIVNRVLDEIAGALKDGDHIELRRFGTFTTKKRTTRTGRNPRSGTAVEVNAKRTAAFRCGQNLRHRLTGASN